MALPDPAKVERTAEGLLGAVFADTSIDAATQGTRVTNIESLRSAAKGQPSAQGGPAPTEDQSAVAWSELQAMGRAAEIPKLDKAAAILATVTTLITGLFIGFGFSTGDFVRMIRDFWPQGFAFLLLAGLALFLGTFAFIVDSYRSQTNLNLEKGAVYLGIACAAAAVVLAAWGLSHGASSGPTRPTISASFGTTTSAPPLSISVNSSDVARSNHLTATVWGKSSSGWAVLNYLVTGPNHDGAISSTITVSNVTAYSLIEAAASLQATDSVVASGPPDTCSGDTSCIILSGSSGPSNTPTPTPSK